MTDVDASTRATTGMATQTPWDTGAWRVTRRGEDRWGLLTITPLLAVYLISWVVPMLFAVYASLYEIPLTSRNWQFIGLSNYVTVLLMEEFWMSLWRGLVFATGSTLVQVSVGVWMALLLHRFREEGWFGHRAYATIAFATFLVPTIVLTVLVLFMFDIFIGVLHITGSKWLGLWDYGTYIIKRPGVGMPLLILVNAWKYSGFIAIFTLAQRRSIPQVYFEAAKSYGATTWQMFRDITFPRIKGVVALLTLFRFVLTFNQFDIVQMLTQGGPGSETTTLPVLAYGVSFGLGQYGLGNALAVVMFLSLFVASLFYFVVLRPSREVRTET